MKKILFIVTQSEMGGTQRYVFEIASNLDKEQYEILVGAGQGDGELIDKLQNINIRTVHLKQMKRTPWPWQILLSIKETVNLLKQEKPDILFLCSTTAGLLGSIASLIYRDRISIVYRIGGWAFKDPRAFWENWLILIAEKLTAPLKDIIIVNSEVDRKLASKYKIAPEKKLVKIYNGIDLSSLTFLSREEARKKFGFEQTTKIIGTVANFYKTKGLKYFIKAATNMSEVEPYSIKFVIIGDGRQRKKLESLIKKHKLENRVMLAGRIPDAHKYLKAFDVFVLPSLKEGFPWIILEAIAAEVPIVATKVGAVPEVLNEESLAEPGNAKALTKKISRQLEAPTKSNLKPEFTSRKMIEKTAETLSKL